MLTLYYSTQFTSHLLRSAQYEEMREDYYDGLEDRNFLTFEEAKASKFDIDFDKFPPQPPPRKTGVTVIDSTSLEDILPYIDWNPFFQTWELRGRYPNRGYPKIFDDGAVGPEALKLFNEAQTMLKEIVATKSMTLKGVVGIFPANRSDCGEDVHIYEDEAKRAAGSPLETFCMLRQQSEKESEDPYLSQADFVAPKGHTDHMGMFAVSCFGCDALVKKYEADHDDYSKIMAQALADRCRTWPCCAERQLGHGPSTSDPGGADCPAAIGTATRFAHSGFSPARNLRDPWGR